MSYRISIYRNIKSVSPLKDTDVFKVLEDIREGKYKKQIALIRVETEKKVRNKLKEELHYVTFSGTFSTRANKNLKKFSGIACLDFDDVEDIRDVVNADPYTFASFESPSGNGLKVLVKIPPVDNNEDYQDYYIKLIEHYQKYEKLDLGTKDLARACYVSYDPKLFLNNNSELFTDKFYRPLQKETKIVNIPITDQDVIAERLDKWFTKRWNSVNRNNNLHAFARQMNAFGVDKNICEQYLYRYEQEDFRQNEIQALINSAYKYTNEFNSRKFEDKQKVKEIKNKILIGDDFDKVKASIKDVEDKALQQEYEKHKTEINTEEFWYYTEKGQIKLSTFRFMNYLEDNNIFKFYPDAESGTYLFIKNDNNFISIFEEPKIKDFVLNDLRAKNKIDAFEMMADYTKNFQSNYLSMLSTIDVNVKKDTATSSFVFYKNGAVEVTSDGIKIIPYKEINTLIWKKQVIDRTIDLKEESDGVFKTFIWFVSGQDIDRYYTLKSVIGYLMHSYQNEAEPKAIIFNDEMISEDIPNGGSGKGLIHRAIGHIKNVVVEDGKKFDPRGQFAYQKVNKDTQIFLMDDVPKHFNFESLFSIVTEGMTVEKKGQDAYQIPFSESPKISITTNYTINGSGASHERRVFEVEIANYFNEFHTPKKEFKHLFFSDWDEEEWQRFDNFMIRCVQYFLKNGLVQSDKVNLELRKLKNELGAEFMEFMELQSFDGHPLNRKEFRDKFNQNYPNVARYNTPQKFNKKVKDYCNFYKIDFEEKKYNGVVCFYLSKQENDNEDVPF